MKYKAFLLTVASFLILSCNQFNLRNPNGSVCVNLPSAATRSFVAEDETVDSYGDISYKLSLHSSAGLPLDEKSGAPGAMVLFPDLDEGTYVVKAYCYGNMDGASECIAAGYKSVAVKGGEVTPVVIPLTYNRISNVDEEKSSFKYSGPISFASEEQLQSFKEEGLFKFLTAEIVLKNGWTETESFIPDIGNFSVVELLRDPVSDVAGFYKYSLMVNWRERFEKVISLYVDKTVRCETWESLKNGIENNTDVDKFVLAGAEYSVGSSEKITIPAGRKIKICTEANNPATIYVGDVGGLTSFFEVEGALTVEGAVSGVIMFTGNHSGSDIAISGSAIVAKTGSKVTLGDYVSFYKIQTNSKTNGAALKIESNAVCEISGKTSFTSCVVNCTDGAGGAIYNLGTLDIKGKSNASDDLVSFSTCAVTGNNSYGGAIYSEGKVTVKNCKFFSNEAILDGGALCIKGGSLSVSNTNFSKNVAVDKFGMDISFTGTELLLSEGITYTPCDSYDAFQVYTDKAIKVGATLKMTDKFVLVLDQDKFNQFKSANTAVITGSISSATVAKTSVKYINGDVLSTDSYAITSGGKIVNPSASAIVGFSADNPCVTLEELKTAIANVSENGTVYIKGTQSGSQYEINFDETLSVSKSYSIEPVADDVVLNRTSNGAYISIAEGKKLTVKGTASKKFTFKDTFSGDATTNFILGTKGLLDASYVAFSAIKGETAVQVKEAELKNCSFSDVSIKYGAVYINKGCSAVVENCTFTGVQSDQVGVVYPDIYFCKKSDETKLTLKGRVTSDIGIYINNIDNGSTCLEPKIAIGDGITFSSGKKLNVKLIGIVGTGNRITMFTNVNEAMSMNTHMTFASGEMLSGMELKADGPSNTDSYKYEIDGTSFVVLN